MRAVIVDLDDLPEWLADALENAMAWHPSEEVVRCGDCAMYDRESMSCSGGMDAQMWPSDFCCFGVRVVSPRKPTKKGGER